MLLAKAHLFAVSPCRLAEAGPSDPALQGSLHIEASEIPLLRSKPTQGQSHQNGAEVSQSWHTHLQAEYAGEIGCS